MINRTPRWIQ